MPPFEEESGELVLPASAAVAFRKALLDYRQEKRQRLHEVGTFLHELLLSHKDELADRVRDRKGRTPRDAVRQYALDLWDALPESQAPSWSLSLRQEALDNILPFPKPGETFKVIPPTLREVAASPSREIQVVEEGAVLSLEKRTVVWSVEANEDAVTRAWASPLGQALEKALAVVKWGRDSGGVFRYSSETEPGTEMEGKLVGRITASFGPLGVAASRPAARAKKKP